MEKIAIAAAVLTLAIVGFVIAYPSNGKTELPYTHSFTKAFCNQDNLCQDYEIICKEKTMISSSPITGAVVQFDKNWQDPRPKSMTESLC